MPKERNGGQGIKPLPTFLYYVTETVTETGVLCLICIIHKMTLLTETAIESVESASKISLRGLATQVRNRGSQQ